jgi:lysophospholipase L1-like esterase
MAACVRGGLASEAPKTKENRWEGKIRQFEARDAEKMPPPNGILFVGSSSIVGWKLEQCFPDLPVINRGFGGSEIADSLHFAPRIILPYRPKIIVLYAGDNDVAKGKSPERVLADYRQFVKAVHHALPQARIVFIAIKPSLRRWQLVDKMRKANALIRAVTEKDDRLSFVDIDTPMIGDDGKPRRELFKDDGLHLNAEGYKLWTSLVLPHLTLDRE